MCLEENNSSPRKNTRAVTDRSRERPVTLNGETVMCLAENNSSPRKNMICSVTFSDLQYRCQDSDTIYLAQRSKLIIFGRNSALRRFCDFIECCWPGLDHDLPCDSTLYRRASVWASERFGGRSHIFSLDEIDAIRASALTVGLTLTDRVLRL
jgi:hypothetical protein